MFVLFTHLGVYASLHERGFYNTSLDVLFSGNTGVQVFFTLSGFLISLILLREYKVKNSINLKNFYIRRFLRLLPPLCILLLLVAGFMWVKLIPRSSVGFIMAATYTYNFIPIKLYTGELGHTWSLAVEEQFYFLWPMVLLVFTSTKKRIYFIAAAIFLCITAACAWRNIFVVQSGVRYELGNLYMVDRWLLPAFAPIMVGALAAIAAIEFGTYWKKKLEKQNWPLLIFLLFYTLPLLLPTVIMPLKTLLQSLGIALLLLWIFFNQQSALCSFLEIKGLNYLGKISYGIYIYQGFFLRTGPEDSEIIAQLFPYNILLTFLAAIVSYEFIEKPVLKLKSKFS